MLDYVLKTRSSNLKIKMETQQKKMYILKMDIYL